MAYQVDGGGGADAAARAKAAEAARKAAEEAARKAAEEAARKAAEEAARKAAEEAARKKAQEQKDTSGAVGAGRYAAYAAPEEAAPPPQPVAKAEPVAPPEPPKEKAESKGFFDKLLSEPMAAIGDLVAKPVAAVKEAIAQPKTAIDNIMALVGLGKPAAPAAKEPEASPALEKIEQAADTAGTPPATPEAPALPAEIQGKMELAKEQSSAKEANRQQRNEPPSAEVRAENAKVPVDPKHEYLVNTLEPAQQQAFKELTPQSRANFQTVYEKIGGLYAEQSPYAKEASHGMRKMLQEHRLEVKDTKGETLIDTLAKRADQPLQEAMQANSQTGGILQSVIKQVAYPDRVYQGENTNTCASTALQGILATEDPAEFARIATGLVFDGQVDLQGGANLKLDASKVNDGADGDRSQLSDALQTSFDTFAKQFPAESETDFGGGRAGGGGRYGGGRAAGAGRFGGGRVGGGGRYGEGEVGSAAGAAIGGANGGQVDGGGLTQNQIEKLYEKAVGRLAVNVSVSDDNRFSTLDGVAAALGAGQKVPVGVQGVDAQGNATHHMISVLDIRKDAKDPGNDKVVFTDPGTGQVASLPVNDFAKILEAAIIPAQFADHLRWNVAPNEANPYGGGRAGSGGRKG